MSWRVIVVLLIGLAALKVKGQAGEPTPLRLVETIPLPNVEGRIDHMAVDLKGQRSFVAALGNNTVEVLDLHVGKRMGPADGQVKRAIVGGNNARLYNFTPQQRSALGINRFAQIKENYKKEGEAPMATSVSRPHSPFFRTITAPWLGGVVYLGLLIDCERLE